MLGLGVRVHNTPSGCLGRIVGEWSKNGSAIKQVKNMLGLIGLTDGAEKSIVNAQSE